MTTYAAYDDQAIWGTGATEDQAREDAAQWVDHENRDDVLHMRVAPMSPALADHVDSAGGNVAFHLDATGVLRLGYEEE